jgi:hypothetical protein
VRLIRSFPATIPAGLAYVVDDAERMLNEDYSYRGLTAYDDDVVHLDWDQAVNAGDLARFRHRCVIDPDQARVVPVLVDRWARPGLTTGVWNCRVYQPGGRLRYATKADGKADLFGFGMVYLPGRALAAFEAEHRAGLDDGSVRFDDTSFSGWYTRNYGPVPIDWDIPCVHLHYSAKAVFG